MQISDQLKKAIDNYLAGIATTEEKQQINDWFYSFRDDEVEVPTEIIDLRLQLQESMQHNIRQVIQKHEGPAKSIHKRILLYRITVAAAILLILFTGTYFLFNLSINNKPVSKTTITTNTNNNDVMPGGDKATLTLSDGTSIVLDTAKNGRIADQGNATVLKVNNGQLAYNTDPVEGDAAIFNTLATPRGGQYRLVLADGSQVWLNAASSIQFPTSFVGHERKVSITGEAYFEVTKDAERPFKIDIAGKGEITVLGTHFNVLAYTDEPAIKTTLLEGAVKLKSGMDEGILKSSQEAILTANGKIKIAEAVNMETAVAWKNGLFIFKGMDIEAIMRQIGRWYDLDVVFKFKPTAETYSGKINRNTNLSEVLTLLKSGGIRFTIEGKTIIVTPEQS